MIRAYKRKYHIIYKTTCIITGRWYIGMHSTDDLEDGYLGSGNRLRRSINKHGENNHIREILEYTTDRKTLSEREKAIVNAVMLTDPLCLNIVPGGEGGNKIQWTVEERAAQSAKLKGRILTTSHRNKIRASLIGQTFTDDRKQNIRLGLRKFAEDRSIVQNEEKSLSQSILRDTLLNNLSAFKQHLVTNNFIDLVNNNMNRNIKSMVKANVVVLECLMHHTSKLPTLSSIQQRAYHILHDMPELPKCSICNGNNDRFHKLDYRLTCSTRCAEFQRSINAGKTKRYRNAISKHTLEPICP